MSSKVQEAALQGMHPTQLTIGMIVVQDKRKHLAGMKAADRQDFMREHPMPAVVGPEGKLYITDHHHLARAAFDLKIDSACFEVDEDFSALGQDKFWVEMDKQSWVHPLDHNGVRHRYEFIPKTLDKLVDDVYRSVAGFVRDAGGYDKTHTAFAEFIWADFFRRNIPIEDVVENFQAAVKLGQTLARSPDAKRIPGYKG